jgi:hypothetical protein
VLVAMALHDDLARLEATQRREPCVLHPHLPALEVLQVDLRHLHTAVAHELRVAVELATDHVQRRLRSERGSGNVTHCSCHPGTIGEHHREHNQ